MSTIETNPNVSSLAKAGSAALNGAVTLTGGIGVTLTQSAQDISVAAAVSGTISATAFVVTDQTTTSGSYTDLATTTDTVTVTIGSSGVAFVILQAAMWASATGVGINTSVALSGANTVAAGAGDTPVAVKNSNATTSNDLQTITSHSLMTGLTPGSTTFKMKYLVGGGVTGHYSLRRITVIPM